MRQCKLFILIIVLLDVSLGVGAQQIQSDSIKIQQKTIDTTISTSSFYPTESVKSPMKIPAIVIPSAMIAFGAFTMNNHNEYSLNEKIQDAVWEKNPHKLNHADNFLQIAPAASVYLLNAFGIKSQHNFRDRTMIFLMSSIFANAIVFPFKKMTNQLRPDSSNHLSFPSGHTAEAFVSAEFMRMEFKDISPWYGVAGYAMAAATGYLRMYNNKHWFSDVVAGAGVGILSAKLAYWLYPKIQHNLFKDKPSHTFISPNLRQGNFGITLFRRF